MGRKINATNPGPRKILEKTKKRKFFVDHEKSTKNRKSLQGNARKIKFLVSVYKYYIPTNRIFRKKNEFFVAGFGIFVKSPP